MTGPLFQVLDLHVLNEDPVHPDLRDLDFPDRLTFFRRRGGDFNVR